MKRHSMNHKHNNFRNAGFSLVEVLIAMAILAVIVVPLLHTFITAARTNAKARKVMQSTTIAQNIMEEIKAYALEDIAREFNNAATGENGSKLTKLSSSDDLYFEAYKDSSNPLILKKVDANKKTGTTLVRGTNPSSVTHVYEKDGDAAEPELKEVKFTGQSKVVNGKTVSEYSFVIGDLHVANSPNTYDAVVTLTADPSTAIANISSMNRPECAYYVQPSNERNEIVTKFWTDHQNMTITETESGDSDVDSAFADQINRSLLVDYDGSSVTVSYEYTCMDNFVAEADRTQQKSRIIYNSFVNDTELESIYVYYYPLYTHMLPRDFLTVKNSSGKEITVYLIKMVDAATYSVANEQDYKISIQVNDTGDGLSEPLTKICTNIDDDNLHTVDFNTINSIGPLVNEKALIKNLGNSTNQYVKYSVLIDVYEHRSDSFTDAATFDASSAVKYTSFSGSTIDTSKIED